MQSSTIMLGTLQNSTADTITIGNANGTSLLALNSFDTQISGQATVGQLLFVKGFCVGCNSGASDMRLKTDVHSLEGSSGASTLASFLLKSLCLPLLIVT